MPAVEINATFYRPHRASTFERWAASVPRSFRFSVKIPNTITHDQRLVGSTKLLKTFLADLSPLGSRLGCLLVQLPPSLEFNARVARTFFAALRKQFEGSVAIEPRHATWLSDTGNRILDEFRIARVAARPAASARRWRARRLAGTRVFPPSWVAAHLLLVVRGRLSGCTREEVASPSAPPRADVVHLRQHHAWRGDEQRVGVERTPLSRQFQVISSTSRARACASPASLWISPSP